MFRMFKKAKIKKINKVKTKRSLSRWGLIKLTTATYRANFWQFSRVAAVVVVASSLIRTYDSAHSNSNDVALFLYLAGLYALVALFWLNYQPSALKRKISQVYVASSARFLPFLNVSILQGLMSLPLVAGLTIIILGISLGLTIFISLAGAVLVAISIILLVWFSLAAAAVLDKTRTSIAALRQSRRLVRGNFWRVLLDFVVFFISFGLAAGLITELASLIPTLGRSWIFQGLVSGAVLSAFLPLFSIFLYNVYQSFTVADASDAKS